LIAQGTLACRSIAGVIKPRGIAEATEPTVVYADQMPQRPALLRTASAERSGMGGGFIEFLFSDGQSGRRYQPQPSAPGSSCSDCSSLKIETAALSKRPFCFNVC
jgi:hypothetical protein